MCYAAPGPRCASHLSTERATLLEKFARGKITNEEFKEKLTQIAFEYHGTRAGQKALMQRVNEASDEETAQKFLWKRHQARKAYEQKLYQYKLEKENKPVFLGEDTERNGDESIDGVRAQLYVQHKQWQKSLSPEDEQLLTNYTNQDYSDLNAYLYNEDFAKDLEKNNPAEAQRLKKYAQRLNEIIATCPTAEKPRVLYRTFTPRHLDKYRTEVEPENCENWVKENYRTGTTVTFDSFTSTAASPNVAVPMLHPSPRFSALFPPGPDFVDESEINTVFEIITDKGAPVSYYSHMTQEAEVLLPSKMTFEVKSVLEKVSYATNKNLLTGELEERKQRTARVIQLIEKK